MAEKPPTPRKKPFRRTYDHRFVQVQPRVWDDERVRRLSHGGPNARDLYFFLLFGTLRTAIPGVSRCGRATLADALGWEPEDVRRCFAEIEAQDLAVADWDARLVFLTGAFRQDENCPTSPGQAIRWRREINDLPACDVQRRIDEGLRALIKRKAQALLRYYLDESAAKSLAPKREVLALPPAPDAPADGMSDGISDATPDGTSNGISNGTSDKYEYEQEYEYERRGAPPTGAASAHTSSRPKRGADKGVEDGDATRAGLDLGDASAAVKRRVNARLDDALRVYQTLLAARQRVMPRAKHLPPTYKRLDGIATQLEGSATVDDCLHVIAALEAEIKRGNSKGKDYFDHVSPFRPDNFDRYLGRELAGAPLLAVVAAQPPPTAGGAAGSTFDCMPNGQPWPRDLAASLARLSSDAERQQFLDGRRRNEAFRFDPDGSAKF